eukprot:SM007237S21255  [mRNA]  locus=s7237:144:681:- [translate_table: standard]
MTLASLALVALLRRPELARSGTGHSHEAAAGESPLVKHLKTIIRFRGGPISVAEYMEEVLTNPRHGFYMKRDVFGAAGDFVTSPDVSQMFGEVLGCRSSPRPSSSHHL